jgi:hypothetical protein
MLRGGLKQVDEIPEGVVRWNSGRTGNSQGAMNTTDSGKSTTDLRSYKISEGAKFCKGAKLQKAVKARTLRNSEIP